MAMNDSTIADTMSVNRSPRIAIRRGTLSEDGDWGSCGVRIDYTLGLRVSEYGTEGVNRDLRVQTPILQYSILKGFG